MALRADDDYKLFEEKVMALRADATDVGILTRKSDVNDILPSQKL